jgi:hypothetical protein
VSGESWSRGTIAASVSFGTGFVSVCAVSDLCAPDGTEFHTHVDDAALYSVRVVTRGDRAAGRLTSGSSPPFWVAPW